MFPHRVPHLLRMVSLCPHPCADTLPYPQLSSIDLNDQVEGDDRAFEVWQEREDSVRKYLLQARTAIIKNSWVKEICGIQQRLALPVWRECPPPRGPRWLSRDGAPKPVPAAAQVPTWVGVRGGLVPRTDGSTSLWHVMATASWGAPGLGVGLALTQGRGYHGGPKLKAPTQIMSGAVKGLAAQGLLPQLEQNLPPSPHCSLFNTRLPHSPDSGWGPWMRGDKGQSP